MVCMITIVDLMVFDLKWMDGWMDGLLGGSWGFSGLGDYLSLMKQEE